MNSIAAELQQRIEAHAATIGVVGLGYVGLPLAVAFAEEGFPVIGVDADAGKVDRLSRGSSPVEDVADDTLARLVGDKRILLSASAEALGEADAIVICVPTPLSKSKEPDITHVVAAAVDCARILRPGQLVVLESTTYPGTTEEVLLPRFVGSGMAVGQEFFLAFSPERVDPGNRIWHLSRIPKVVAGITPDCCALASALYAQIIDRVVPVSTTQTAEMVKLFENSFRSVNIALVNELAIMCRRLGLSVWEVIEAASTKPFGFMPFEPGPGIGGHCLPSDPYYLSWKARLAGYEAKFIAFADEINRGMPAYVVQLATDALNEQVKPVMRSRLLALGVAYKPGVADVRESPAIEIIDALLVRGALVEYSDPRVPEVTVGDRRLKSLDWATVDLGGYDLVIVLTAHAEFDARRLVREARLVLDTRNLTGPTGSQPHVIRL